MNPKMVRLLILPLGVLLFAIILPPFICSTDSVAPEVTGISRIELISFTPRTIELRLYATVANKNPFSLEVKDLQVAIMNIQDTIGTALQMDSVRLPSRSSSEVALHVHLRSSVMAHLLSIKKDTIHFRLQGTAAATASFLTLPVNIDIPFVFSVRENLLRVLQDYADQKKLITINSASIEEIELAESQATIEFSVHNPFDIPLILERYPSKIYINGTEAGAGDLGASIEVVPKAIVSGGRFKFRINNLNSVSSLLSSFFSRELKYETEGILHLEVFNYKIEFPYTSRGVLVKL